MDDKKALVITKATEMQSLSEQMNKLQSEIQELNIAINSTESNLKQNKELFVNTGNTVMGELDAESEKINNYII